MILENPFKRCIESKRQVLLRKSNLGVFEIIVQMSIWLSKVLYDISYKICIAFNIDILKCIICKLIHNVKCNVINVQLCLKYSRCPMEILPMKIFQF